VGDRLGEAWCKTALKTKGVSEPSDHFFLRSVTNVSHTIFGLWLHYVVKALTIKRQTTIFV